METEIEVYILDAAAARDDGSMGREDLDAGQLPQSKPSSTAEQSRGAPNQGPGVQGRQVCMYEAGGQQRLRQSAELGLSLQAGSGVVKAYIIMRNHIKRI